ncbi:MAG: PQQ-binding-like beta-propeller repeat protein [Verrucomicrobiia bacterium]
MLFNLRYLLAWLALLIIEFLPQINSFCGDWNRWGGPDNSGNMYSAEKNTPVEFDPGKLKQGSDDIDFSTTKNVRWIAKLGSQSYGNVVVGNGKVLIGTNNEFPRDNRHKGDRSILLCLSEKTGEFLWQLVIPKHRAGKAIDYDNLGLLCSPTIIGNRIYIISTRGEVLCLDIDGMKNGNDPPFLDEANYVVQDTDTPSSTPGEKDADIIWLFNMLDEVGSLPHNAVNGSPLVIGNILYATTSNGADFNHNYGYVPFPFAPNVIALDATTGRLIATDDAQNGMNIFHGQWSSISSGKVNDNNLIFYGGGDGWLYALNAKPIKKSDKYILPVIWKADCNPPEYKFRDGAKIKYPDPNGPSEIVSTPVFFSNRVYVTIGQDPENGEGVGRLLCFDATRSDNITTNGLIWDCKDIKRSLSTVSIDPETGLLFVADFSGFVYCFDALNGKMFWSYDMKGHIWGSTLVADGKVYVGNEEGDFVVLPAKKEFNPLKDKPLFSTNFGSPIYSTPVIANGVLYVSTPTTLYAITNKTDKNTN